MKLTVMGSPGKANPSSLVAVDNIIIKMATNESRNITNKGAEPETDFKSKVNEKCTLKFDVFDFLMQKKYLTVSFFNDIKNL